jgi:hypothetical protein
MALRVTLLASYLKNIKRNLRRLLRNTSSHSGIKGCNLELCISDLKELMKTLETFENDIGKKDISSVEVKSEVVGPVRHFVKQYQRIVNDINDIHRDQCVLTERFVAYDYL